MLATLVRTLLYCKEKHIIRLISHLLSMHIFIRVVFLVFLIACVHTLPQNEVSSNELTLNDEGNPDIFNDADSILDQADSTFNEQDADALNSNSNDGNVFDSLSANTIEPEKLSSSPPYYCDNGRKAACCKVNWQGVFSQCAWYNEFLYVCKNSEEWLCCLHIYFNYPNKGEDCKGGYMYNHERYATPDSEEPEESITPSAQEVTPNTSNPKIPSRASLPTPSRSSGRSSAFHLSRQRPKRLVLNDEAGLKREFAVHSRVEEEIKSKEQRNEGEICS